MTAQFLAATWAVLALTSLAAAGIAHLPHLQHRTRSYYKHTAWEMLAIAFIKANLN